MGASTDGATRAGAGAARRPPNAAIAWAVRIEKVLDTLLGLMLLAVAATLFYQVFGRYVVGRAPAWTEEVARMLVAWMAKRRVILETPFFTGPRRRA